jgi:hypothetical protein
MDGKDGKERHDIFNSDYSKRKDFLRKDNVYRLLVIVGVLTVFIWGSRDYIYGYITDIEVRNRNHQVISKPFLDKSGEAGYFIFNRAPYSIRLEISCNAKGFKSSYNNAILAPNMILYISFSGNVNSVTEIIIRGVKID